MKYKLPLLRFSGKIPSMNLINGPSQNEIRIFNFGVWGQNIISTPARRKRIKETLIIISFNHHTACEMPHYLFLLFYYKAYSYHVCLTGGLSLAPPSGLHSPHVSCHWIIIFLRPFVGTIFIASICFPDEVRPLTMITEM